MLGAQVAPRSLGPCIPLVGCVCRGSGKARHHGGPARARDLALCACQLPKNQVSGDMRLEKVPGPSPGSHLHMWLGTPQVSPSGYDVDRPAQESVPGTPDCLPWARGWFLDLMLVQDMNGRHQGGERLWQAWADWHTKAQRETGEAKRRAESSHGSHGVPSRPFALP